MSEVSNFIPNGCNPHPSPYLSQNDYQSFCSAESRRGNAFAFTLAEVLITLVIIGVIAAITVPTLMGNAKKEEILSKTKKTYSTLSQAVLKSKFENGPIETWYDKDTNNSAKDYFEKYWKPYLQTAKQCFSSSDCGYKTSRPWKTRNGDTFNWYMTNVDNRLFFYLNDGIFVAFRTESSGEYLNSPILIIDINGPKKPNMFGKDVFFLIMDNQKGVLPRAYNKSVEDINSNCSKTSGGDCCLKKIMNDGWTIKDDYPL